MESIILQLYHGDLAPEEQFCPRAEGYQEKNAADFARYEAFIKKLSAPLAKEFISIMDEQLETAALQLEELFRSSFQMGARFMLEMLSDKKTDNPFTL